MKNQRNLMLLGVGAFLVILAWVFMMNPMQSRAQRLDAFLDQANATAEMREAYHFALEHPETLKVIPCYCGCGKHGHKSNYHCFMKEGAADGKAIDNHGLFCPMCVQIALESKRMLAQGKSLKEIRMEIDTQLRKIPGVISTPTPHPAH